MSSLAKHRVAFSLAAAAIILIAATVAIFWARGFKPDFKNGRIERTGLIVAASTPTGAQVYLDDRLTSATDTNIAFLDPKTYKVRIQKDGYTTWQKEIEVKADLASEVNALLFPLAPEIKPLTTTGAANPTLSPDNTQIVYAVTGERGGIFLMPLSDRPFPFRQDPRILARNRAGIDFSGAQFIFSPDSKQVIARFTAPDGQITANLLIDTEKTDQEPRDITASQAATLAAWQEQLDTRTQTQALAVPNEIKEATAEALPVTSQNTKKPESDLSLITNHLSLNYFPAGLIFSPDEEKILYSPRVEAGQDKQGKYKVYNLKTKKEFTLPAFADLVNISWYPDSNHLVVAQKDLISVIEADGENQVTVHSGKFENGFVFPHPSGTRLIILTTLTQTEGTPANLYSINLR